jgi:signal transduction histidine kinase
MEANIMDKQPANERDTTKLRGHAIVRTLVEHLDLYESKQSFLREIDRRIIRTETQDLDAIFRFVCDTLKWLLRIREAHFYVAQEEKFLLSCTTAGSGPAAPPVLDQSALADHCESHHEGMRVSGVSRCANAAGPFAGQPFLAAPVLGKDKQVFGLLVLETDQDMEHSPLHEKDTCTFVSAVAGQVSVAITYRREEQKNRLTWEMVEDLFRNKLDPFVSLNTIARQIPRFLPDYSPLKLREEPGVQILFLEKDRDADVLVIRGTVGEEWEITQVKIDGSVCGLLFEDLASEYVVCNPLKEYPNRYKWYLGKKNGATRPMRSELAVPVEYGQAEPRRFAVLNLESPDENAFQESHIADIRDLAQKLAPILCALRSKIQDSYFRQQGIITNLEKHLGMMAGMYMHSTKAPYTGIKLNLDIMQDKARRGEDVAEKAAKIEGYFQQIMGYQKSFCQDIVGFATDDVHPLKPLLEDVCQQFSPADLEKNEHIELRLDIKPGAEAASTICSLYFKQIIQTIIENSVHWVKTKTDVNPAHAGLILVSLELITENDNTKETNLNEFCKITVWDNGPGADEESLPSLTLPGVTHRLGGTGFGLYAAKEYVTSIEGRVALRSTKNEFFEVSIFLRKANPTS